jgi:hypothetical protein
MGVYTNEDRRNHFVFRRHRTRRGTYIVFHCEKGTQRISSSCILYHYRRNRVILQQEHHELHDRQRPLDNTRRYRGVQLVHVGHCLIHASTNGVEKGSARDELRMKQQRLRLSSDARILDDMRCDEINTRRRKQERSSDNGALDFGTLGAGGLAGRRAGDAVHMRVCLLK